MHSWVTSIRVLYAFVVPVLWACSATTAATQLSGINDVEFIGTEPQSHLGNGFVIEYEGQHFGVTAKHVLLMASKSGLKNTDINIRLKSWALKPNKNETAQIRFGEVINGDAQETLDERVLLEDVLVFEVEQIGSFRPIRLAKTPAQPGDKVRTVGCSYQRAKECVQDEYVGQVVGRRGPNLLIDLGAHLPNTLFGLSGAPVMNAQGELVGIVSNMLPDDNGIERFAPVDIEYLKDVLSAHRQAQAKGDNFKNGKL